MVTAKERGVTGSTLAFACPDRRHFACERKWRHYPADDGLATPRCDACGAQMEMVGYTEAPVLVWAGLQEGA